MNRLPPILARDRRRHIWGVVQLYASLAVLTAIIFGVLR